MNSGKPVINLIVIKTDKIREQFEFYSALGLDFEYHRHGNGPAHYASSGTPVIEIYPLPKGVLYVDNTTRLGFTVEDIDLLIQDLRRKGVKIISESASSDWGYGAVVQDIDGRKVELTQRKTDS